MLVSTPWLEQVEKVDREMVEMVGNTLELGAEVEEVLAWREEGRAD